MKLLWGMLLCCGRGIFFLVIESRRCAGPNRRRPRFSRFSRFSKTTRIFENSKKEKKRKIVLRRSNYCGGSGWQKKTVALMNWKVCAIKQTAVNKKMKLIRVDQCTCWVCFEVFKEPITLLCLHSFCKVSSGKEKKGEVERTTTKKEKNLS